MLANPLSCKIVVRSAARNSRTCNSVLSGPRLTRTAPRASDGATARGIAARIEATERELAARPSAASQAMAKRLAAARRAFLDVVDFVVAQGKGNPNAVFAGAVPYLMLAGTVVCGWQMGRALMAAEDRLAEGEDAPFMAAKIVTARFYGDHLLGRCTALRDSIVEGADAVTAMALEAF